MHAMLAARHAVGPMIGHWANLGNENASAEVPDISGRITLCYQQNYSDVVARAIEGA